MNPAKPMVLDRLGLQNACSLSMLKKKPKRHSGSSPKFLIASQIVERDNNNQCFNCAGRTFGVALVKTNMSVLCRGFKSEY